MASQKQISFATFCAEILGEPISPAWIVTFKAFDGESLDTEEQKIWRTLSGQDSYEPKDVGELAAIKGRRSQGTKTGCKFLCYKIHTENYRRFAARTDRLHVPIISQSRDVSAEIMSYLTSFYQETELRTEVEEIFKDSIRLRNGFVISTQTCSYRAPRGITVPLCLLDEVGVWKIEGSDVDREVYRALKPAMIQFPNRKLVLLGSPWVKGGLLWDAWCGRAKHSDRRITIHAPTHIMNPLIPAEELASERAADPLNFRREFLAEFVDDVGQFLSSELIERSVVPHRTILPYSKGTEYRAFVDPSGGVNDSMCLAIGHLDAEKRAIVDLIEETFAPFSPQSVVASFSALLTTYHCTDVVGDGYSAEWVRQEFEKYGISYRLSEYSKSEIYLSFIPLLTGGCCELPDNERLKSQFAGLERRSNRGGRDSVDHLSGSHDDLCNCVAGVLTLLRGASYRLGVVEFLRDAISRGAAYCASLLEGKSPSPRGELIGKAEALQLAQKSLGLRPVDTSTRIEAVPPCNCGAICVTRINNFFRCGQCGQCWAVDGAAKPDRPFNRNDIFPGRVGSISKRRST